MSDYPFLRPEFLAALETSESVGGDSGWQPMHLSVGDGAAGAFMPLYRKTHSWGEYVFDWAWANAYQSHGRQYYPKLVSAIPFTPASGPRIRLTGSLHPQLAARQLLDAGIEQARHENASSWHILFPDNEQRHWLEDPRLIRRTGVQYHWFNDGYGAFDDFLGALNSRKRKMIRKERQQVKNQGLSIHWLTGTDINADLWQLFYRLYHRTYLKRSGGSGYLSLRFFLTLGELMPEQLAMAVAQDGDQPVAVALYFHDHQRLYGRYWGCVQEYDFLHFELCYYQGIEFVIRQGLQRFDAGAQGEHKLLRGFRPVLTHSLHWIADPAFDRAIRDFCEHEHRELLHYQREAESVLPFRQLDPR